MPESRLSDKMRDAIVRAAERELDLHLGTKPINDAQIAGVAYDVRVEGTYLGWTSEAGKAEARELYDSTPSRLRPRVERAERTPDFGLSTQVGLVLKKCREIEADLVCGERNPNAAVGELRTRLEILHESVLLAEQRRAS